MNFRRLLLPIALLAAFAAQARTLTFYFYQDDYVPFAEIATHGARTYVKQLVLAQDLTPNWRVIPGLMYLAQYEIFGMTPLPMHIAMLALHLGTVALLYRLIVRTTAHVPAAFAAALIFGVHPTYAGALGQVATVPHVASAFFLVATLSAIVECVRATQSRVSNAWLVASIALYVLALMSNESMAIIFPAFGLAFLLFDERARGRLLRASLRTLPFAVIGFVAVLAVRACDCTEASTVYSFDHAPRVFLIYSGRLLYPIGLEPPSYIDAPHLYASFALLALAAWMLAFGPRIGRVGAVWMLLAIVPHIFVETHTANRFTYLATPGFVMLIAGYIIVLEPGLRRVHLALPAVLAAAALVLVTPWFAWQTHLQNEPWQRTTTNWRQLHDEVIRLYPDVPPNSRVEIVGGPLTHPLDNFFVMPALAATIWGPTVTLQTFATDDPYVAKLRTTANPYVAEYRDGHLVPLR